MSYCRFSEADVYVFMHTHKFLECCGCSLGDQWDFHSTADMVAHLREHIAAGHDVPAWVIPQIEADDAENFPPGVVGGGTP